ncbi:hypothetical protein Tco_0166220, partial [Tanacetum coccineum]
ERIEKTKRSKNDQKPARNEKKTKSQEQDKEISQKSQPVISPTQSKKETMKSRVKIKSKGPKLTSFQSLKGLFGNLKFQGPSLPREESVL